LARADDFFGDVVCFVIPIGKAQLPEEMILQGLWFLQCIFIGGEVVGRVGTPFVGPAGRVLGLEIVFPVKIGRFLELTIDQELAKLAAGVKKRKTDPFDELTVLMIDVDHFKRINDTYGHPFGDEVLKCLGETLKESTRQEDVVVRYGGEEFCVVLAHTGKEEALRIAEKIRKAVEQRKLRYVDQEIRFTISVGVASAREDHLSASRRLIQAADIALYNAKWGGRNLVYSYKTK
jgi:diguanylate cyclase (GGDEF)-like protein